MLTPEQEQALVEGRIDIGVLRPPIRHDSISSRTITVEPLVLVMPEDHRLADEPVVSVADLRAENFVMYAAAGSVVNDAVVRSCMAAGFTPHREHEVAGTAILLALVAAGLGIALVPMSVESVAVNGVVFKPVEGAESVELALAWRADDDSALLESFLTTLEAGGVFHPRAMDAVSRTAIASKDAE